MTPADVEREARARNREAAAQLWCEARHELKEVDADLAESIAALLDARDAAHAAEVAALRGALGEAQAEYDRQVVPAIQCRAEAREAALREAAEYLEQRAQAWSDIQGPPSSVAGALRDVAFMFRNNRTPALASSPAAVDGKR